MDRGTSLLITHHCLALYTSGVVWEFKIDSELQTFQLGNSSLNSDPTEPQQTL